MRDDRNESSGAVHGIGAILAGMLSLFARSADDVARMGAHCVDDIGRACMTTSDDIGSLMTRNTDDLFRQLDDFRVRKYVDDVSFEASPPRVAVSESDEGMSVTLNITKEAGEAVIKIVDLNDGEADK